MEGVGFLAIDLGASSGKAVLGSFDGNRITMRVIHRFDNIPVSLNRMETWDILFLHREILESIRKAIALKGKSLVSVGIDSWGVDFGLIDRAGFLIGNPFHYRNSFKFDVMEKVISRLGKWEIFRRCPAQLRPFNTLYQIEMIRQIDSELIERADTLLNIPSLINYFLTGEKKAEFTMATTTQMFNAETNNWDDFIINKMGIQRELFPEIEDPCTVLEEVDIEGVTIKVVLPATHDTASAFASIPYIDEATLVLSSGTWIPLGMVNERPANTVEAMEADLGNEGCIDKRYRILTNMTGLWLLQEVKRILSQKGMEIDYDELIEMARKAKPFLGYMDVDREELQKPDNMIEAIKKVCKGSSGYEPEDIGEIVRISLESLALKVVYEISKLEKTLNRRIDKIHMLGGGVRNKILCKFIADATNLPLKAGPVEGACIGNIIGQMIASGYLKDFMEASDLISNSFDIEEYEPINHNEWEHFIKRVNFLSE